MNRPTDDRLHDWVRQTLHPYEAPDNPEADWFRVRRELRRRRWWRVAGGGFLLVLCSLIWWISASNPVVNQQVKRMDKVAQRGINQPDRLVNEWPMAGKKQPETSIARQQRLIRKRIRKDVLLPVLASRERVEPILRTLPLLPILKSQTVRTHPIWITKSLTIPAFGRDELAIRQQFQAGDFGVDSTVYQSLTRNISRWFDAVAVCDLTSSMYPYTTQLMEWFKNQQRNRKGNRSTIQGVVFFTDCDTMGLETSQNGPPGQFFVSHELTAAAVMPVMLQAARHTRNNQFPAENDLEALLFAQRQFPNAKNLILLADNGSPVKGMEKLGLLTKPVRVILAGTHTDSTQAFQADYEAIARQSGGSLHTIEDDLDPMKPEKTPVLRVGNTYYRYIGRKKTYSRTKFSHRPERLLGPIWW